jgi:hypothetical protein
MASLADRPSVVGMTDSSPVSPSDAVEAPLAPIRPEGFFGGARLLAADARVVSLLIDDARRRAMQRLYGIPKDQPSGVETLMTLAVLGGALRSRAPSRPSKPSLSDSTWGFGVLREVGYGVAGPWARETPGFGALIAFALVGAGTRVVVRKSVQGIKGVSHEAYGEFHHRYGHLIRRNRRRAGAAPAPRERGSLPLSDT